MGGYVGFPIQKPATTPVSVPTEDESVKVVVASEAVRIPVTVPLTLEAKHSGVEYVRLIVTLQVPDTIVQDPPKLLAATWLKCLVAIPELAVNCQGEADWKVVHVAAQLKLMQPEVVPQIVTVPVPSPTPPIVRLPVPESATSADGPHTVDPPAAAYTQSAPVKLLFGETVPLPLPVDAAAAELGFRVTVATPEVNAEQRTRMNE